MQHYPEENPGRPSQTPGFDDAAPGRVGTDQFLTLMLGEQEYGLPILDVQEIRAFSRLTPLPNAPSFVRGVINLRGLIVPVIDLRARFGLEIVEYTRFTVFVVVRLGTKTSGLAVDAVADVVDIPRHAVQSSADIGSAADPTLIRGIARLGERVIVLLRLDALAADGASAVARSAQSI